MFNAELIQGIDAKQKQQTKTTHLKLYKKQAKNLVFIIISLHLAQFKVSSDKDVLIILLTFNYIITMKKFFAFMAIAMCALFFTPSVVNAAEPAIVEATATPQISASQSDGTVIVIRTPDGTVIIVVVP